MNRRIVAFLISFLIVSSSIVILVNIAPIVVAPSTLYVGGVGPGNYSTIQQGIDAAVDGDTVFVYNGTYVENLFVDKTLNLIGEDVNGTIIDGNGVDNTMNISANWVNITGFTVTGGSTSLEKAGIVLFNASNCQVFETNISMNGRMGILLFSSHSNNITNNYASYNNYGIGVYYSYWNMITNNSLDSNDYRGIFIYHSDNNSIINNDALNTGIEGISLLSSKSNNIFGNNASFSGNYGIYISYGFKNNVTDNIALSNDYAGIYVDNSDYNNITNNILISNGEGEFHRAAIYLTKCDGNNITNNHAYSNGKYGIFLQYSDWNNITDNEFIEHYDGLYFWYGYNNNITGNIFSSGLGKGIDVHSSGWNTFTKNTVRHFQYGIYIFNTYYCDVYHNNLIDNKYQASDNDDRNVWDSGYPTGGNFWSDYLELDENNGPNQDIPGSDGIGDIQVEVDSDSIDHYPLFEPLGNPFPPDRVYNVDKGTYYSQIKMAVHDADEGNTILVSNGSYYENFIIYKTLTLIGEDRNSTVVKGCGGKDTIKITSQWVNFTEFKILTESNFNMAGLRIQSSYSNITENIVLGGYSGIYLFYQGQNSILDNVVSLNHYGINVFNSDLNDISNNIVSDSVDGIRVDRAENNSITDNVVMNNVYGIVLASSSYDTLSRNTMIENGFYFVGDGISYWNSHHIDTSNTVNGKPVQYMKSQRGGEVPPGAGQVILADCTDVRVKDQELSNCTVGLQMGYSSRNFIHGNTIANSTRAVIFYKCHWNRIYNNQILRNGPGVQLTYSSNNTIVGNEISYNNDGIDLGGPWNIVRANTLIGNRVEQIHVGSVNNRILSNNIVGTSSNYGILVSSMSSTYIIGNSISGNDCGIRLSYSDGNNISYNSIFQNKDYGLYLFYADNNEINRNTFYDNGINGIYLPDGDGNNIKKNNISYNDCGVRAASNSYISNIFNNNFINNIDQGLDINEIHNWNATYPTCGNYWSDYSGVDIYNGPSQNITGPDGIGDTPYIVDGTSEDMYPLMNPYDILENSMFLNYGWNLISIPLIQDNEDITAILDMLYGYYGAVQWYDGTDAKDPWKHYKPDKYLGNDLDHINEQMGFWIDIIHPDGALFFYEGTQPGVNQTIQLHEGWNQVGYPSPTSHDRTAGLNNLDFGADVDCIQWYDAAAGTWHSMSPGDHFVPGRGYWIHSNIETTWEVPL